MATPSGGPKGSAPKTVPAKRAKALKAAQPATGTTAETAMAKSRFGPAQRKAFLNHLAETANVSESCKVAGVHSRQVYDLRKRSYDFRSKWAETLAEGYARIEAWLMQLTLAAANGTLSPKKLAENAQAQRIALSLLSAHRATVRGSVSPLSKRSQAQNSKAANDRVEMKLRGMRARLLAGEPE